MLDALCAKHSRTFGFVFISAMDKKPKELEPARKRVVAWLGNYMDVKSFTKFFPTLFLLGVSLYVGYHMEISFAHFKSHNQRSISEREYYQQAAYEDIMSSINEFDGESVALNPQEDEDIVYRYERKP